MQKQTRYAIYGFAGAVVNSFVRGGFVKKWLPNMRGTKLANAVLFLIAAYIASNDLVIAAVLGLGIVVGQAPAIFSTKSDEAIANKDWIKWAYVVALRGLVWALPLIAASIYWLGWEALYWLVLSPAMVLCYALSVKPTTYSWVICETLFGVVMWFLLAFLFYA